MQKKVLALQDLSGFGRAALVPVIAAISALGHQCVPVPTALYSSHAALPDFAMRDLTQDIPQWLAQYTALGLRFDAVYAGFLSNTAQVAHVIEAIHALKSASGMVFVDPIMGDNGKLYQMCSREFCGEMEKLCHFADILVPNCTEAAVLLGRAPTEIAVTPTQAEADAIALAQKFHAQVVLTGIPNHMEQIGVVCCTNAHVESYFHERIPVYYPGTGDLFAAVMLGTLLAGQTFFTAANTAALFVKQCAAYTQQQGTPPQYGVLFETQLHTLTTLMRGTDRTPNA